MELWTALLQPLAVHSSGSSSQAQGCKPRTSPRSHPRRGHDTQRRPRRDARHTQESPRTETAGAERRRRARVSFTVNGGQIR
eukprot:62050-Prymnesium_polylepis.1